MIGEPDPAETGDLDDDAPLVERLDGGSTRPRPAQSSVLWRVAALLALVALLAVGALNFWPRAASTQVERGTSLSIAPPAAPFIPAGWGVGGPGDASHIAFGQSPPTAAYACGPDSSPPLSGPPGPIDLYSSADDGNTWHVLSPQIDGAPKDGPYGLMGVACALSVDPVDSKDVVLFDRMSACGTGFDTALYRSHDGGASWQRVALPSLAPGSESPEPTPVIVWVGTSMFVVPQERCGTVLERLAVSANRGAFVWVNQEALLSNAPAGTALDAIIAAGSYLYVHASTRAPCPATCQIYRRSNDGGQIWTTFSPHWQGRSLSLLEGGAQTGGRSLYADDDQAQQPACPQGHIYFRSIDDGATWTVLPDLSDGLAMAQALDAPDGTLYANVVSPCGDSQVAPGIYRLRTIDHLWVRIAADPQAFITLSWDEEGLPGRLWATLIPQGQVPSLIVTSA